VSRPSLEVADIFRGHGPAWRRANAGHVSLGQLKVMSAIENCRTAALGGHVARCEKCAHSQISYNSCRNRHCPKCQGAAAKDWLAAREADLLPVPYYHVVFTLPAAIADIAYQNKAVVYDLLFKVSAQTLLTIAADPKHLGARIGITAVLHTWGSALTHHPHVHMIVPGGGISPDGQHWVSCRLGFFLPVRVLSRLFRRLFLEKLIAAHQAGRLSFFGDYAGSPPASANRRKTYRVQRQPQLIRRPRHRCTTRCIGAIQIRQLARGAQIPIASAAPPYVPSSAVSSLGGFRTPAAEYAALSLKRPASETLHIGGHIAALPWMSLIRRGRGRPAVLACGGPPNPSFPLGDRNRRRKLPGCTLEVCLGSRALGATALRHSGS
jgi:hypothetical protein